MKPPLKQLTPALGALMELADVEYRGKPYTFHVNPKERRVEIYCWANGVHEVLVFTHYDERERAYIWEQRRVSKDSRWSL